MNHNFGYFLYLLGMFINIFLISIIKYIGINNILELSQIIFFRAAFGFLILLPFQMRKLSRFILKKEQLSLVLIFCLLATIDVYLWNYAIQKIPTNNVILLNLMLSPIAVFLNTKFFLREKSPENTIQSIIINFIGTLFILGFAKDKLHVAYILLFISFFCWNTICILVKKIQYNSIFLVFLRFIFLVPISFLFMTKIPVLTLKIFIILLFLTIGQISERILITRSLQISNLIGLQVFKYFHLIFSIILSYLFFKETINFNQLIGIGIIVFSTVFFLLKKKI